ncbi:MAG: hypothetical protein ACYTEQ_24195 [Planctomycetota bacterium]|jgi:DNA-directed RNA polymerase subunit RPC12/RpoP
MADNMVQIVCPVCGHVMVNVNFHRTHLMATEWSAKCADCGKIIDLKYKVQAQVRSPGPGLARNPGVW